MKDVVGYESLYAVTSCGKVWSYQSKKFLKPVVAKNGYMRIMLYKDGQRKMYSLHRLVAMTYLPNPENLPEVNHKDENKTNNCIQNLEWCDRKYNHNYGTINERISNSLKIPILQYTLDGEFVHEWPSASDVGKEVCGHICDCLKGRYKQAYGFVWKYKESEV